MAVLKIKDIKGLDKIQIESKLKDLNMELIKKSVTANKSSKIKTKEIKKAIARLLTLLNKQNKEVNTK